MVETKRGEFKGKGAVSWETIRPGAAASTAPAVPTDVPEDEKPVVVGSEEAPVPSKPRGGLQSAADLRAENERKMAEQARKKAEAEREIARQKAEREARGGDEDLDADDPNATVYRDASGKRIDVKLRKAELAKQKREELEKEMARMEWGKGLVQKDDAKRKHEEAEALKHKPVARWVFILLLLRSGLIRHSQVRRRQRVERRAQRTRALERSGCCLPHCQSLFQQGRRTLA